MFKYFYWLITLAIFTAYGDGVDISTWMYQIKNIDDSSIDILASSSYDMLVLEAGFNLKDKEDRFNTEKIVSISNDRDTTSVIIFYPKLSPSLTPQRYYLVTSFYLMYQDLKHV